MLEQRLADIEDAIAREKEARERVRKSSRSHRAECVLIARAVARHGHAYAQARFGRPKWEVIEMVSRGRRIIRAWKRARRDADIVRRYLDGEPASRIAKDVGISERQVRNILRRERFRKQRKLRLLAAV